MIATLLLAAALGPIAAIRPDRVTRGTPRFVVLRLRVNAYGINGTGTIAIDRSTGAFVRRLDVGPISEQEGSDGRHAWRADATGFPRIEGNRDRIGAIRVWSHVLSGAGPTPQTVAASAGNPSALHVRWADVARGAEAKLDSKTGLLTSLVRCEAGEEAETWFADYRTVNGLVIPFELRDTSDGGTWIATVRSAEFPQALPRATFAPPAPPHDVLAVESTTLPMLGTLAQPVIAVQLNNGPPLRMILDTGGQNVITPSAAQRLGLHVVGGGKAAGVGSSLASTRFAWVARMTVGNVVLRQQPFIVLDLGSTIGAAADGIVGYELLARLGARVDFARRSVTFVRDAYDLAPKPGRVAVPFVFSDRQPQVSGGIDAIPGSMTIDTGADDAIIVTSPAVRSYHLVNYFHATVCGPLEGGVGGAENVCLAHAKAVRLGRAFVRDPGVELATHSRSGATADPSTIANIGDDVLGRFTVDFDYARQQITLSPNGTPLPPPYGDLSGILLAPVGQTLRALLVLTGTPAYAAGIRAGAVIVAIDGTPVTSADYKRISTLLRSKSGTRVTVRTSDDRTFVFHLRRYI